MNFSYKRNLWVSLILLIAISSRIGFEFLIRIFNDEFIVTEFFHTIFRYSTYTLTILIFFSIIIKNEYSVSKLPWLLILVIEPFTGLFLFLTFGRDFRESNRHHLHPLSHPKKYLIYEPRTDFNKPEYKIIDSEITDVYKTAYNMTGHHAYLNDSKVTVLTNGTEFFPKLFSEIEKAEKFVFVQFYIIRTDYTGSQLLQLLGKKATQGVEVKVLYDALGSVFLDRKLLKNLRQQGVQIVPIDKIRVGFFDTKINYRNHRKVVVVDGKVGFVGGMNLADEYYNKSKRYPRFRDTQLLIEGAVINSLTALFFRDWYYTTDEFVDDQKYYTARPLFSEGLVQIIPSGPDFRYPPIRNVYVKMINNAKKSIKIMTPYLALDRELVTSLMIASQGGVDVSIIVPGIPDKKYIYEVTRSFFEELLEEGIKIYTMNHTFSHAKVLIVDDILASCGTYNLDNRSARINFEVTVLLFKQGVTKLVSDFKSDVQNSTQINLQEWKKRGLIKKIIEGSISLFSPFV